MAMGKNMKFYILTLSLFIMTSCSSKPCREVNTKDIPEEFQNPVSKKSVFVYKYDGTKQCGEGQEVSLDAMSKQLRNIKILSMTKKNDGMMRIQVCGAPTGQANVYEIEAENLKKAKEFGFQEWKF
jgi:uncharacterized lipoprotein YajG